MHQRESGCLYIKGPWGTGNIFTLNDWKKELYRFYSKNLSCPQFLKIFHGSWSQFSVNRCKIKGAPWRRLLQCNISNRIDEFRLNLMVPFFMPQAWQNFEIFGFKVETLCTGSYEGEWKKWLQRSFLKKIKGCHDKFIYIQKRNSSSFE